MGGSFGYELDISRMSDEEKDEIKEQVKLYREYAPIIRDGDYYRLKNDSEAAAWEVVAADGNTVLLGYVAVLGRMFTQRIVKLRGLDANARYLDTGSGKVYTGGMLMHAGLNLMPLNLRDRDAVMICLKKI